MHGSCGKGTQRREYGDPCRSPAGSGRGARHGRSGAGGFAFAGYPADRVRGLDCGEPAVGDIRDGGGERLYDDPLWILLGHGSTGPDEHAGARGYGSVRTVELKDAERLPAQ